MIHLVRDVREFKTPYPFLYFALPVSADHVRSRLIQAEIEAKDLTSLTGLTVDA